MQTKQAAMTTTGAMLATKRLDTQTEKILEEQVAHINVHAQAAHNSSSSHDSN